MYDTFCKLVSLLVKYVLLGEKKHELLTFASRPRVLGLINLGLADTQLLANAEIYIIIHDT